MTGEELRNSNEYKFVMFSNGLYTAVCDKLGKQATKDILINDFKIDKRIAKKVADGCEKLTIEEIVHVANELDLKLNVSLEFIPKKPPIEFVEELLSDLVSKYHFIAYKYALVYKDYIIAVMTTNDGKEITGEEYWFMDYCIEEDVKLTEFYAKYKYTNFVIVDKEEKQSVFIDEVNEANMKGKTIKWDFENKCVKIE